MPNTQIFKTLQATTQEIADKQSNTPVQPMIMEIDGLCEALGIGKNTAYKLLTSGEITSFKVGSVWKIPTSAVEEYIAKACRAARLVKLYHVINQDRDLYYEKHGDLPIKY